MMPHVTIYTDGACTPNPGKGGWGALLTFGGTAKGINGVVLKSTNSRMDLMAAIKALEALKKPCKVDLYSQSQYLIHGMTKGRKRRMRPERRGKVPNADLWNQLDKARKGHSIRWRRPKENEGYLGHEKADELSHLALSEIVD